MPQFENGVWRAKISEEFTFNNVRAAARACATLQDKSLIVSYDSRFLSDKFAEEAVKVFEEAGIPSLLTERDTPLPVVLWEVADRKAGGAFIITGGELPAQFNGIKFIQGISGHSRENQGKSGKVERFDPRERYFKYLEASVDGAAIGRAKLKVIIDPMHGSGRGYLDKLLQRLGCRVEEIHGERDVLFGGREPHPAEANLHELKKSGADVGIALSGDASSYAWYDAKGGYHAGEKSGDAILACLRLVEKLSKEYNK